MGKSILKKSKTSLSEMKTISLIATRAVTMGLSKNHLYTMMDIEACHTRGCPLDLDRLETANDVDFSHDISGIFMYLNRTTGKLTEFFHPRFAKSQ